MRAQDLVDEGDTPPFSSSGLEFGPTPCGGHPRTQVATAVTLGVVFVFVGAIGGCGGSDDAADDAAGPEPNLIVPGVSIDRASLGMSESSLSQALGTPTRTERSARAHTGGLIVTWVYRRRGLEVSLEEKNRERRVLEVSTTSPAHRTREGARVGISEAELERRLKEVDCGRGDNPTTRWCIVGGTSVGDMQTVFEVRDGRVSAVRVVVVS